MRRRQSKRREKTIAYELIPEQTDAGRVMYELLWDLVSKYHEEINNANVRIVLAWAKAWKPDVDGHIVLGKCKKASDLDRELAPFDFVILLNRNFWQDRRVTDLQRTAILDHELTHAAVAHDENGEVKVDERGRTVFRLRKHDLEEFSDIAARYGCWKRDIERFADALHRAEVKASGWVGYARLQEALASIGVELSLETIRTWEDRERKDVMVWAAMFLTAGERPNLQTGQSIPPCVAEALKALERDRPDPPAPADHPPTTH